MFPLKRAGQPLPASEQRPIAVPTTEGANETEALARLAVKQATSDVRSSDEEVYRAIIARTTRR